MGSGSPPRSPPGRSAAAKRMKAGALRVHLRSVLQEGDALTSREFRDALLSTSSIFVTSHPFAAAATKPSFQLVLCLISIFNFIWLGIHATGSTAPTLGFERVSAARFTVLGLRDPSRLPTASNNFSFGLLRDGCVLGATAGGPLGEGAAWVGFGQAVQADGYFFSIPAGPIEQDPVRWVVEVVRNDNVSGAEARWEAVSASAWHDGYQQRTLYPHLNFPTPEARGVTVNVDCRVPWPWVLGEVATYAFSGAGCALYSIIGMYRRERLAVNVLGCLLMMVAVSDLAAGTGYLVLWNWRESAEYFLNFIPDVLLAACVWVDRPFGGSLLFTFAICKIVPTTVTYILLLQDSAGAVEFALSNTGLAASAMALSLVVLHTRALRRAQQLVMADKNKYERAWAALLADPTQTGHIPALRQLVKALEARCSGTTRQLNRCRVHPVTPWAVRTFSTLLEARSLSFRALSFSGQGGPKGRRWEHLFDCGVPDSLDPARPIDSLDQLYYQASALEPILIEKVQSWARISRGCFGASSDGVEGVAHIEGEHKSVRMRPFTNFAFSVASKRIAVGPEEGGGDPLALPKGYVHWEAVEETELSQGQGKAVKWGRIKSVQRAMEKVNRSYQNDVSRLLDVCRQSIYFESVSGIYDCLRAIENDPDVSLVRVKNRYDTEFNAERSAGYRNVALNLRIVTKETLSLGIEAHICEVQLLLVQMAIIKNDLGHKKYIMFRNLRGE